MLKTDIGRFDEVEVVVAGNKIGMVRRNEAIAIPDELAALVEWPEKNWRDGAPEINKDKEVK